MIPIERRYVLLRHECPDDYRDGPHYDLMIEDGDKLRTWSLHELPEAWAKSLPGAESKKKAVNSAIAIERIDSVSAAELPPHRPKFLDYEGEVSNGRGSVTQITRGEFLVADYEAEHITIEATTGALLGTWEMQREGDAWRILAT